MASTITTHKYWTIHVYMDLIKNKTTKYILQKQKFLRNHITR